MPSRVIVPLALLLVASANPAAADEPRDVEQSADAMAVSGSASADPRSKAGDWMIMPAGTMTMGAGLQFITADTGLGDGQLRFTDVVLLPLRARLAFAERYELFASASFLPKQPSFTDETLWQSATLGGRVGFGERYAVFASASGGPLLDDRGLWAAGATGVQARKSLHSTLLLEGGLGGSATSLFEDARERASWLTEITAGGELIFRVPNGSAAAWVGSELRVPVAHDSSAPGSMKPYDPQTRFNVDVGVVLSYIEDWDVYARYVVVDRGDAIDPTTTLPILEGGFDQRHLMVGLTRRFSPDESSRAPMLLAR